MLTHRVLNDDHHELGLHPVPAPERPHPLAAHTLNLLSCSFGPGNSVVLSPGTVRIVAGADPDVWRAPYAGEI